MKPKYLLPPKRVRHRIRFKGGPLNLKGGTTLNDWSHRDAVGLPIPTWRAQQLIRGNRLLGADAPIYCLDEDGTTYRWLPDWMAEIHTNQIKELLDQKAEHPGRADELEEKIRALEELAA